MLRPTPQHLVILAFCLCLLITPFSRWWPANLPFLISVLAASGVLSSTLVYMILRTDSDTYVFLRNSVRKSTGSKELSRTDQSPEGRVASTSTLSYGGFDSKIGVSVPDRGIALVPSASVEVLSSSTILVYAETVRTTDSRSLRSLAGMAAELGEGSPQTSFLARRRKGPSEARIALRNPLIEPITPKHQEELLRLIRSKSILVDYHEAVETGEAAHLREVERLVASAVKSSRSNTVKKLLFGEKRNESSVDLDKPTSRLPGESY
jgi:hypothetical protein